MGSRYKRIFHYIIEKMQDEVLVKVICDENNNFYGDDEREALNKARNWIASEYHLDEGSIYLLKR